jgi:predicted MFS family arabinose efflux permease
MVERNNHNMRKISGAKQSFHNPFTALKHKNFRLYWIGMCISLTGTWMQNIAQPWLAYSITKSAFLLSLVTALQFLPMLIFSLFAGVIIDKFSKKKILLLTQSASLMITLFLAILIWSKSIQYWHILIASTLIGLVNTFDLPTRQSFVIELVGREDLMNAIALNMSAFNLARIFGPALAGVVMGYAGIEVCFYANSISFTAVIFVLLFIKTLPIHYNLKQNKKIITDITDGLKYIYHEKTLLMTVLSSAIVGTFAMNFNVIVPVFAKVILQRQEAGFGFLMSFMGVGSLIGALFLAAVSKSGPNKLFLYLGPLFISVLLIITGFTSKYALTGISLAIASLCVTLFSSTANAAVQLNAEDQYRGRVMSIYSLFFNGFTPIGSIFSGFTIDHWGARAGFIVNGITIVLLVSVLYVYKKRCSSENRELFMRSE